MSISVRDTIHKVARPCDFGYVQRKSLRIHFLLMISAFIGITVGSTNDENIAALNEATDCNRLFPYILHLSSLTPPTIYIPSVSPRNGLVPNVFSVT